MLKQTMDEIVEEALRELRLVGVYGTRTWPVPYVASKWCVEFSPTPKAAAQKAFQACVLTVKVSREQVKAELKSGIRRGLSDIVAS
jgi:hypothetical protein